MNRVLLLFQSTRAVVKAERACKENNIPCKIIPVPRSISSECGMALEIDSSFKTEIKELLKALQIPASFHDYI